MSAVFAGTAAAAVCFVVNRVLFMRFGYRTLIGPSPALEEICKSFPAYWLGAELMAAHLVFGCIEGVYDWFSGEEHRVLPALMSVAGHGLFGWIAAAVLPFGGIYAAAAASCGVHLLWNRAVIKFS